jgi:hypothetical protein
MLGADYPREGMPLWVFSFTFLSLPPDGFAAPSSRRRLESHPCPPPRDK